MNKRMTAIGLSAGLLAGAGAGFVLEASGTAGAAGSVSAAVSADDTTDTTDTAATDDSTIAADRAAHLQEILQPLVDDGTLTQAQADKVIDALQAAGPMGGPGGRGHGMGGGFGGIQTVADTLGLTTDEVITAIQGGQTIADLAVANGSSGQAVIDALVADLTEHLAEEVAAGEHTQAEADLMLANATERITEFVNNTGTGMGPGMMGPGGMGGRGHHGPFDDDGTDDGTDTGTDDAGTIDGGPTDSQASA